MATIKNISTGIRGFNSLDGLVSLEPGKTAKDVEISEAELRSSAATGWFEIDGKATATATPAESAEPTDDLDVTIPKLREIAKAEDIDLGKLTAKPDIQGAIRIAREAKASKPADGGDAIDGMDDETLRDTVKVLTQKTDEEVAGLDRAALLALARGEG